MINVIASIHIKEGYLSDFLEIFKSNIPKVHKEKGCVEYEATVDIQADIPIQELNSSVVTIIEKWNSLDDLYTHLAAPHMLDYKEKVKGIVENVSIKVLKAV